MRLLAITNDYPPEIGGIGSYVFELYRRMTAHGIDLRILAPAMPGDAEFDAASGLEVVRHPERIIRATRSLVNTVAELTADRDLIALGSTLPMGFAATRTGLPVLLHTHNSEIIYDRFPGTRWLTRRLIAQASAVAVISDYTGHRLSTALRGKTVVPGPPGVDLERFNQNLDASPIRARFGIAPDQPLIVQAGRLAPRKGQDVMISAMSRVRASVPDAALLIIGSGPYERRLRKLVADQRLPFGSVIFGGPAAWDELPLVFSAGNVFATPCRSRYGGLEVEGFGQVFLEAQACGRPVLVGRSGGAPESTIDGVSGFVVDPVNVATIADRLIQLLSDRDLATRMGAAGRRHVEEHFSWDVRAARFAAALRQITERRRVA